MRTARPGSGLGSHGCGQPGQAAWWSGTGVCPKLAWDGLPTTATTCPWQSVQRLCALNAGAAIWCLYYADTCGEGGWLGDAHDVLDTR